MIKLIKKLFDIIRQIFAWIKFQKRRFDKWSEPYLMTRKLVTVGMILGAMILLFIHAKLAPQQSHWADTPLNTAEPIGQNSTATVSMLSKKYNPREKFMVLNFKVEQSGAQILDPANIKLSAKTIGKQSSKYTVLPLANNHFVMLIEDLTPGYVAVQVSVKNEQRNTQNISSDELNSIDDSAVSSESSSGSDEQSNGLGKTTFKFMINEKKDIEDTSLVRLGQKQYAETSLKNSINDEKKKIKKLRSNIKVYQDQQAADQAVIKNTQENQQYQVQKDKGENTIDDAKTDYQTQENNIETALKMIDKSQKQIVLYQKQIQDIQTDEYRFVAPIQTGSVDE